MNSTATTTQRSSSTSRASRAWLRIAPGHGAVPYPFAHPAAVLPLARPMGRLVVPSALAIGSIVPDLWSGLFAFCLPAGLAVYAPFHLLQHASTALGTAVLGAAVLVYSVLFQRKILRRAG